MKRSSKFWLCILFVLVVKVVWWRINLGVPFLPGGDAPHTFGAIMFDCLLLLVSFCYIIFCMVDVGQGWHCMENWNIFRILKWFNEILDNEKKDS